MAANQSKGSKLRDSVINRIACHEPDEQHQILEMLQLMRDEESYDIADKLGKKHDNYPNIVIDEATDPELMIYAFITLA